MMNNTFTFKKVSNLIKFMDALASEVIEAFDNDWKIDRDNLKQFANNSIKEDTHLDLYWVLRRHGSDLDVRSSSRIEGMLKFADIVYIGRIIRNVDNSFTLTFINAD